MADFTINYPGPDGLQIEQTISSGQFLFMVGANGTGKSTLMHHFANQNSGHIRRITAHRQIWFNSDSVDITPMGRQQTEQAISSSDRQAQSRWKDDHAPARAQAVIFDIIDSQNVDARKIADAARANNMEEVKKLATAQSPLEKLNDILKIANLSFQVSVSMGSKLVAIKEGVDDYSIAELSDGERNALLIAANVLTAPKDTLILLDEPERHLHRSIVSPLLSTLLTYREDCAFVISTHDVLLPLDQKETATLLLRTYTHSPQNWLADRIDAVQELDEDIAAAILGSRRKLLFIEGDSASLDIQLYQLIFPEISIHPAGSCVDVERNVRGLRAAGSMHWVTAFGIIDKDQRSVEECTDLLQHGIAAIKQYSVESIYYHPQVVNCVLARVSTINGIDSRKAEDEYRTGIISSINEHKARLAARLAEKVIRDRMLKEIPDWRSILAGNTELQLTSQDLLDAENILIEQLLNDCNLEQLVSRYPIRETQVPNIVARSLGFQSTPKYEQAVRKMLIDDDAGRQLVLGLLQPIADLILV